MIPRRSLSILVVSWSWVSLKARCVVAPPPMPAGSIFTEKPIHDDNNELLEAIKVVFRRSL